MQKVIEKSIMNLLLSIIIIAVLKAKMYYDLINL